MLSAVENGTGGLELLLRKNSTSARDEIAAEYAFL